MCSSGRTTAARFAFHFRSTAAGRREHRRTVGASLPRRKPDRARTGLAVRQYRAVAVNLLPFEPQRLGLARSGVERDAHHGGGDRVIGFRVTERDELVVRRMMCLKACLAPPQFLARVGVLAPRSERLRVPHH